MSRRVLLLPVLACVAVACGSSETQQPAAAADSGPADTGSATDSGDALPPPFDGDVYPEFTCGPGPWVLVQTNLIGQTLGARTKDAPNQKLTISMSACPEVKAETDAEGYALLRLTVDQPNSLKFEGAGWLPTRWYERAPSVWSPEPFLSIVAAETKPALPGLDDANGVVLVDVTGASGGKCTSSSGVAVSVDGHPEAVITYHGASAPYAPVAGATATTGSGLVSIAGVAPGTKIKLTGTRDGCEVVPLAVPGDVLVEAGTVSRAQLVVREPLPTCGPPPWLLLEGKVTDREVAGTAGAALEGAVVSWSACSGVTATTAADGTWRAWVSEMMPASRSYALAGYLPTIISEQAWPIDYPSVDLALRKSDVWRPLMPGYDDTHGYAIVGVATPDTGPCADPAGVAISVTGHPDAKVVYLDYPDGEPAKDTGGSVTTKRGVVYVSGLTPGVLETGAIAGAKTGCKYTTLGGIDTGRAKVEAGAFSILNLYAESAP